MTKMASLKLPASRLFTQPFIQTQITENIKAPRHCPLCREFTGTGEFPAQRASYAEDVSIWWRHHDTKVHCVFGTGGFNLQWHNCKLGITLFWTGYVLAYFSTYMPSITLWVKKVSYPDVLLKYLTILWTHKSSVSQPLNTVWSPKLMQSFLTLNDTTYSLPNS